MLCDPPIPGGRQRESPAILWPLPAPSQRDTGGFRVEGRAGGSPSSSPRPPHAISRCAPVDEGRKGAGANQPGVSLFSVIRPYNSL